MYLGMNLLLLAVSFWVGVEGLLRLWAGKTGAFTVMSIGFGLFLVVGYYGFLSFAWPQLVKEHKNDEPSLLKKLVAVLFALCLLGGCFFVFSFLRLQGITSRLG